MSPSWARWWCGSRLVGDVDVVGALGVVLWRLLHPPFDQSISWSILFTITMHRTATEKVWQTSTLVSLAIWIISLIHLSD